MGESVGRLFMVAALGGLTGSSLNIVGDEGGAALKGFYGLLHNFRL